MNRRLLAGFAALSVAAVWSAGPAAQNQGKADWLTDGGDRSAPRGSAPRRS